MHTPAAAFQFDWIFQVQHFVIHEVLDGVLRYLGPIKKTADDDGIVCGIVVAQAVARMLAAPRQAGTRKQPVKETAIQIVKNPIQIVGMTSGRDDSLSSAHLPNQMRFTRDV